MRAAGWRWTGEAAVAAKKRIYLRKAAALSSRKV
jgi:hypothetical protein